MSNKFDETKVKEIMARLYKLKEQADDGKAGARGTMANLRNVLVDTKKHRAWPALSRIGIYPRGSFYDAGAFVAGCFALHPEYIDAEEDSKEREDSDESEHQEESNSADKKTHKKQATNFGDTCRKIQASRGEINLENNKTTPTERRFQHLLSAKQKTELQDRVVRLVKLAKSEGVRIQYEQLWKDVFCWSDRTKMEWARSFWTPGINPDMGDQ